MNEKDKKTVLTIAESISEIPTTAFDSLFDQMALLVIESGEHLMRAGDENECEYFLLEGMLRIYMVGRNGNETTLGFYIGPCVLTPSIVRTNKAISRVFCVVLGASRIAAFPYASLVALMKSDDSVQKWGDQVLRQELTRRADREWGLAVLSGRERLLEFRDMYPGFEDLIPNHMIASYLGLTPVSLSRLRRQIK